MSEPILPLRQWPAGIPQASVPANDNALRLEALSRPLLGVANDESGADEDGDVWIVGDTPAGAFANFEENDIALIQFGSWYAWAPVPSLRLTMEDGSRKVFVGESTNEWQDESAGGGIAPVVTESGTALTATALNNGNYTRFTNSGAKTYTFNDAETYSVGDEYHGRNAGSGDLTITEAGTMTINPPAGGTLVIPQDGTFTVKIVAANEADLFGVTVPA